MASVQTTSYQGRYLKLTVVEESYSIADNTSTVRWTLESIGGSSNYYSIYKWGVTVNGQTIYATQNTAYSTKAFPAAKGSRTGTITVNHNSDGTASPVSFTLKGSVYTNSDKSYSGSIDLTNIPRQADVTGATDFNDEQNPTVYYNNPAGNSVTSLQACIASSNGQTIYAGYRDIPKTGTSYTFNLSTAERNALRSATPNSKTLTVRFYVRTIIGGNTFYSNIAKTLTITNANPTISSIAYQDTNSTTTNITQNNQIIIRNNSTLQVTLTTLNALKYATLTNVALTLNGATTNYSLSGTSMNSKVINLGTVNMASSGPLTVVLTDSRGYQSTYTTTIQMEDWVLPSAIITCQRLNNFYTQTDLLVDGSISSLDGKNTMTIQYQYKKTTDSTYSALTTIQDNVQVSFNLDNNYAWNVKVIITDILGSTTYNIFVDKGIPLIFFDRLNNATGFNCFPLNTNGVWSENFPIDDVIYLGSQVLYDSYTMTSSGKNAVLGSYDYNLIDGLFTGITIPSAYEKAYRVTAQMHTQNNNQASIYLNNFQSNLINTWSNTTMRKIGSTRIFKQSEITLETTYGYSRNGTNLYCSNSGNYTANFWNITVHCYLVKKTTNLEQVVSYDLTPSDDSSVEPA